MFARANGSVTVEPPYPKLFSHLPNPLQPGFCLVGKADSGRNAHRTIL